MYADMGRELARLRVEDLVREGCRARRYRRPQAPAAATGSRVGCLPVEEQA